jgi:formylglycine-generating enzyme required for sulfatase activity
MFLSACFNLDEPKCDSQGQCPYGLVCDTTTNKCVSNHDGGVDAGPDATTDASTDSGDASPDTSYPFDGSYDAASDAGVDAGVDAGSDGGPDAGDGGIPDAGFGKPAISGIDGDGTEKPIVCPDAGPCNGGGTVQALHRFRTGWMVSGLRLDTVTDAKLEGSQNYSVQFETGGTSMKRKLLLPITLVAGAFTLTLTNAAGDVSADTYILQGEQGIQGVKGDQGNPGVKGDPGQSVTGTLEPDGGNCTYGGVRYSSADGGVNYVCNGAKGDKGDQGQKGDPGTFTGTFTGDVTFTGSLSLSGTATLNNLNVTGTYTLPDCPEGYTKDSRTDITLCKRGADEMVMVGDFWVDKYEASIVDSTQYAGGACSGAGTPYGQSLYDYPGSFPRTGNWISPIYACSIKGVMPSSHMTWFQAQEACALSGKELCTNEQWQAAAAGTWDTTGPETGNQCHIYTGNTGARNTGLAGATPGGTDSCVSKWGAEDMVGNMPEWVAMWGQGGPDSSVTAGGYAGNASTGNPGFALFSPETTGDGDGTWNIAGTAFGCEQYGGGCGNKVGLPFAAIRGGFWNDGPRAGVFALSLNFGPSFWTYNFGFRCCRGR